MSSHPDIAYYYPAPYWSVRENSWIKSLLLFFDQIAILLPNYMYGRHQAADPTLVEPLEDRGLLQVLEPGTWIDEKMANHLAEIIVELLTNGTFDDLPKTEYFHELSQSLFLKSAGGDFRSILRVLAASDSAHQEPTRGQLHPRHRTCQGPLDILCKTTATSHPREGALHHPTTVQNRKSFGTLGLGHNFNQF